MGFLLFLALLLVAVIAFVVLITRWLWKKGFYGRLLFALITLGFSWLVYDAIHPSESFYVSELKRLVNVTVPPESKFLYKTVTYPDLHGDYSACFVISLSSKDMAAFEASLVTYRLSETKTSGCYDMNKSYRYVNVMGTRYNLTKKATREDAEITIDFVSDQRVVIINWHSW
jgi:hypothetical protein